MTKKLDAKELNKLQNQVWHFSELGDGFNWELEEALEEFLEGGGDVSDLSPSVTITPKFLMAIIKKEMKGK